ncbi:PIG-L family deacetylase [Actinomadura graeca]|uniref:PIG-L family deacetylase n=1 Tax=Actinomadura graeca TaxID=2750812 RepID=A0ABX8QXW9_9ACTN|nr:PIG-L family deacetylase [Actinomadura graeca]QXJ22302.1 PIG-L family deacetylase [Actinomadura graeca]
MPSPVVFSPHLDDAAFSASAQLMRAGTRVVTVFAGPPPDGVTLTHYDRLSGARSSRERHRERLAEDDRALDVLGCAWTRCDELDDQYRDGPVDQGALFSRLEPHLASADEIWIPAGIGGHPDHVTVRDTLLNGLARRAAPSGPQAKVRLYADLPYAIKYGWPSWVTGEDPRPYLDIDYWLAGQLTGGGLDPARLTREAHRLPPDARARKDRAVREYRTQLPCLGLDPANAARWDMLVGYEVSWRYAA